MKVAFNPAARQELVEAARWYANEASAVHAEDLKKEIRRSLELAITHPALGAPAINGTRSLPVHRYPYVLIYRIEADVLRVLAVFHHSRRPGYWRGRR